MLLNNPEERSENMETENQAYTELSESEFENIDYGTESDFYSYHELKKKQKMSGLRKKHVFLNIFLIVFLVSCAFLTPIFNVNNIIVKGNTILSEDKIIDASGIYVSKNIFTFQCAKAEDGVEKLSFVDTAEVKRTFPAGVIINIKECKPIAQISCGQSLYLVVDKHGKVLDTADKKEKYNVPEIDDTDIVEFEVGKVVNPANKKVFDNLLILAQEIENVGISDITEKISSKDSELILHLDGNVRCNVGVGDNLSYRVKFIKEVYESIPENKSGELKFVEEYKAVFTEDEN